MEATTEDPETLENVIQALCERLKEQSWTIVFKTLIVFHVMLKEGAPNTTIVALSQRPRILEVLKASSLLAQGKNIYNYSRFLSERAKQYGRLGVDYAQVGDAPKKKIREMKLENGLLRNVEGIQAQLRRLIKCQFVAEEIDNDIAITAFRLLVGDLLVLFKAVNIGVINVLEHYFEMGHHDAAQSLRIYKTFVNQTEDIINYLSTARSLEFVTKFPVPNIKHAPISLTASLEEYLNDPDFEENRKQYLQNKSGSPVEETAILNRKPTLRKKKSIPKKKNESSSTIQKENTVQQEASSSEEEAVKSLPETQRTTSRIETQEEEIKEEEMEGEEEEEEEEVPNYESENELEDKVGDLSLSLGVASSFVDEMLRERNNLSAEGTSASPSLDKKSESTNIVQPIPSHPNDSLNPFYNSSSPTYHPQPIPPQLQQVQLLSQMAGNQMANIQYTMNGMQQTGASPNTALNISQVNMYAQNNPVNPSTTNPFQNFLRQPSYQGMQFEQQQPTTIPLQPNIPVLNQQYPVMIPAMEDSRGPLPSPAHIMYPEGSPGFIQHSPNGFTHGHSASPVNIGQKLDVPERPMSTPYTASKNPFSTRELAEPTDLARNSISTESKNPFRS